MPYQKKRHRQNTLKLKHKSAQYTKLREIRIPTEPEVIYQGFTSPDHQDFVRVLLMIQLGET